jgi:hypothetical protein
MKGQSTIILFIPMFLALSQTLSAPAKAADVAAAALAGRACAKPALTLADFESICGWEYCPSRAPFTSRPPGSYEARRYDERELGRPNAYGGFSGEAAGVGISYRFAGFVSEASRRFRIPVSWIRAVIRAESQGDVFAISPKGAMGLMQIMPSTWTMLRARYGLGANPYDPHDNIVAGTAYLRELHDLYGSPGFLAAYNAGPARYEQCLNSGQPLPAETQDYVAALLPLIEGRAAGVREPQDW